MNLKSAGISILIIFLVLAKPTLLVGQETQTDVQQIIAEIVEDLTAKADDEQDYTQLIEDLIILAENPININAAKTDDLKKLIFLSDFQINSLIDFRDSTGTILSIYELQTIPGFDIIDIQRLTPFIKAEQVDKPQLPKTFYGRNDFSFRYRTSVETPVGYSKSYTGSGYLGDKNSYYARYSYRGGKHLQAGFVAEKDPGEPFFDGTFRTGVDYISGYISLSKIGIVKKVIIGDYHAEFGQGLTFWNSLSFGKSSNTVYVRKRADGLVRHSSAYESQFLRGAGVTLSVLKADLTVFASYRNIDANISDTLESGDLAYTSLPETGYHRTASEIANRNTLTEFTTGTNITYSTNRVKTGLTFAHSKINGNFDGTQAIYELTPKPSDKTAIGASVDVNIKQYQFFGELASDLPSGKLAALAGGMFQLSNTVQLSILGRSYSRTFNPLYTAGFAEGSGTSNENGIYAGISILPTKGWKLSGYIDLFEFPWLKFGANAPSSGQEFMALSEHSFTQDFSAKIRYRVKSVEKNQSNSVLPVVPQIKQTSQNLRLQLGYNVTSTIAIKTILETSMFDTDSISLEQGYLLAQDVSLKLTRIPVNINFRFAIFDTPSWDTRIYSYENDMLYSFSVPAYYSKGTRFFVLLKYSPKSWFDIWLRYSQTYYSELDELGQGADLIEGNTRSEVKAMVRLKF